MEEPGDVGAAFHLRQSREGTIKMVGVAPYPIQGHAHPPLPTYKVHTVFSQPMETLEEEKERKECHEARAEVIPKNGEGQTSLSDSIPGPFQ